MVDAVSTDAMWADLVTQMRRHSELDRQHETLMMAAMLTGEECEVLGSKCRIRLEWPDGLPMGMTEDQLRETGRQMKARALREDA